MLMPSGPRKRTSRTGYGGDDTQPSLETARRIPARRWQAGSFLPITVKSTRRPRHFLMHGNTHSCVPQIFQTDYDDSYRSFSLAACVENHRRAPLFSAAFRLKSGRHGQTTSREVNAMLVERSQSPTGWETAARNCPYQARTSWRRPCRRLIGKKFATPGERCHPSTGLRL